MESLWDLAVKDASESLTVGSTIGERSLVFCGSKTVGKSTMIQKFLDKNDPVEETLALEYTFGRKSGHSLAKDICHIWELGGGTLFSNLLPSPFGKKTNEITLVLVLDLSAPNCMWATLETLLQQVYNHLKRVEDPDVAAPSRLDPSHEDARLVSPFPVPLVIVGAKYDLFQDIDPEKKKMVCRTLRQVAHYLVASLVFYSNKDPSLVKRLKDVLNQHGFGGSQWKGYITDYSKPLCVPCGADSFQQIGLSTSAPPSNTRTFSLDKYKHVYTSHFPQDETADNVDVDDPAKDPNYKEPVIDSIAAQRSEELDHLRQEIEHRKRVTA